MGIGKILGFRYKLNRRGHLAKTQSINFKNFKYYFVEKDSFYKKVAIFEEFEDYLIKLSEKINQNSIEVWINGSFITDEPEPSDIDFVVFVDNEIENFSSLMNFTKDFYWLDVYFIATFESDSEEWINYWKESFSTTKDKKHKKGFLKMLVQFKNGLIID